MIRNSLLPSSAIKSTTQHLLIIASALQDIDYPLIIIRSLNTKLNRRNLLESAKNRFISHQLHRDLSDKHA
jgi:hypothetical protein